VKIDTIHLGSLVLQLHHPNCPASYPVGNIGVHERGWPLGQLPKCNSGEIPPSSERVRRQPSATNGIFWEPDGRGRTRIAPRPAQIRTCGLPASGSCQVKRDRRSHSAGTSMSPKRRAHGSELHGGGGNGEEKAAGHRRIRSAEHIKRSVGTTRSSAAS
jgi:hypothetical protein